MRFTLSLKDFLKGLLLSVLIPVLTVIQQSIDSGTLTFNWKLIAMTAIGSMCAYLLKNFLTNDVKEAQNTIAKARDKGQI